jgi:hypothetical protein
LKFGEIARAGHLYGRTIEQPIDGLSFLAYRRVGTKGDACRQVMTIDPRVLEAARQMDAELANNLHDTLGAAPSAAKVPDKPSANKAVLREQAVADCEGFWDRGTHMTKQE